MNIRSLFCAHSWKEQQEGPRLKLLICQKCGEVKEIRIPCEHSWELEDTVEKYSVNMVGTKSELPIEITKKYVCKKCGETRDDNCS